MQEFSINHLENLTREYCLDEQFGEEMAAVADSAEARQRSRTFSYCCRKRISLTDKLNRVIAGEMADDLDIEYSLVVKPDSVTMVKSTGRGRLKYDTIKRDSQLMNGLDYTSRSKREAFKALIGVPRARTMNRHDRKRLHKQRQVFYEQLFSKVI